MSAELERARSALLVLDPGCERSEWVSIGMAAKSAGLFFEDFNQWSANAANYAGEKDCKQQWDSFKPGGSITSGTLFYLAQQAGWKAPKEGLQRTNAMRGEVVPIRAEKTSQRPAYPTAAAVWELCEPATAIHPYIQRKQGVPTGLRVYPATAPRLVIRQQSMAGWLVVPCRELDGALQTLQFISPAGDKLNLPGASFGNGFFMLEEAGSAHGVVEVEGIGQAWAALRAMDVRAAVCFGAGRAAAVANALRVAHPGEPLTIALDRGKEAVAEQVARAVNGEWCPLPTECPANYDINDFLQEHGPEALASLLRSACKPAEVYPLSVAFAHELPEDFTPMDELIRGVLTAGGGSVLYGDSNSGKTFLAVDMCCAVARGLPWMDRETEPGLVIYLAAESPASVRTRLQAYQKYHAAKVPNFAIVQSPIDLYDSDADTEAVIQLVRQLEAKLGQPARLIVGDTLARLSAGANENAGQDMGLIVRRFDRIRSECKAHFMLIHHSGKNAAAGARGWSGIRAAMDTEIEVTDSPTGRCAEITKQRDLATKGERIGFRLEGVILGLTKWREPATSCVVVPADAPAKQASKRISEIGGAIQEVLRARGTGMRKGEMVSHFSGTYDKSSVYREMKRLVDEGLLHEVAGVISLLGAGGANGAN